MSVASGLALQTKRLNNTGCGWMDQLSHTTISITVRITNCQIIVLFQLAWTSISVGSGLALQIKRLNNTGCGWTDQLSHTTISITVRITNCQIIVLFQLAWTSISVGSGLALQIKRLNNTGCGWTDQLSQTTISIIVRITNCQIVVLFQLAWTSISVGSGLALQI